MDSSSSINPTVDLELTSEKFSTTLKIYIGGGGSPRNLTGMVGCLTDMGCCLTDQGNLLNMPIIFFKSDSCLICAERTLAQLQFKV